MRTIKLKFIVSKQNLLNDIENSYKDEFPSLFPISLERIKGFLDAISDDVSFLLEFPYIDEHFRDCYYSYHAEKFQTISRETIRVHIFSDKVKDENCIFDDDFSDEYYGFFIIRPLKKFPLGRKFLSPKILKQHNFLCCLTEEKVYLFGKKFLVQGFPHISQDTETHTCAESSLWVLTDYYGSKYKRYQKLLPSEIIDKLNESARRRMLPSSGLSINELSLVLMKNGHNCILYTDSKKSNILSILRIYIESGIPLIISVQNESAGHAMVAIGHEDVKKTVFPKYKTWIDISEINKKICVMDDNRPPYAIIDAENPTKGYEKGLANMEITSLVVPLHKHMFMDADMAFKLMSLIFDSDKVGLKNYGNSWKTRLFLTSSNMFKNSIFTDEKLDKNIKDLLLKILLPKFIWVCEIYKDNNIQNETCDGILVFDSTGGLELSSVKLYWLESNFFLHDGGVWTKTKDTGIIFRKKTYRHNLKGEWNQWQA